MKKLLILGSLLMLASCADGADKQRFWEEHFTLNDGTPCVILKGGSHSGYVGMSCNWNPDKNTIKEKNKEMNKEMKCQ